MGDDGLSNSSAGRVSIFFFPSFFLSYIKKRIVFAFLHNPFYTTHALYRAYKKKDDIHTGECRRLNCQKVLQET